MTRILLMAVLAGILAAGFGYRNAVAPPIVRWLAYHSPRFPTDAPPVRLVLLSDIHGIAPDMTADRIARVVAKVNALRPDCVLLAGDFVSDRTLATRHLPAAEVIAPLVRLRPRVASYAVLGNHDHWRDPAAVAAALAAAGVRLLGNTAARCGPVTIGGIDDAYTRNADMPATRAAMRALGGVPILLSHGPDVFPASGIGLTLAGHTHCGQISLPLIGPLATASSYGGRYACGIVREGGRTLVVTAGIGTSLVPIRFGAPPDLWLIEVSR